MFDVMTKIIYKCDECGEKVEYCEQCNTMVKDWSNLNNVICAPDDCLHFCSQQCVNDYENHVVANLIKTKSKEGENDEQ